MDSRPAQAVAPTAGRFMRWLGRIPATPLVGTTKSLCREGEVDAQAHPKAQGDCHLPESYEAVEREHPGHPEK